MGCFDLPSRWVFVYFEDGLMLNVVNTDTFSDAEAQAEANRWTNSSRGKEHGKVVRIDFRDRKDKLLKLWVLDKSGRMEREPLL